MGVGIAEIIPAGADEGIQGIGVPSGFPAADGAGAVHEFFMRSERGLTGRAELDVIGEFHGKVFFGHGYGAAFFAMNHGNGGAPISLAGHRPVAEPVIDFLAAFSEFVQPHGNGVARFVARKTVKFPAVNKNAVFAERKDGFAAFLLDDLRDGQMIFSAKA